MSRSSVRLFACLLGLALGAICRAPVPAAATGGTADPGAELSGGETTVFDRSPNAFGRALANLDPERWYAFREGKELFVLDWIPPADAPEDHPRRGLGPRYNATACAACHFKDGRGRRPGAPETGEPPHLLHLSLPASPDRGDGREPRPEPVYGSQLNDRAVPGEVPEGRLVVTWEEETGRYPDGEGFRLRRPRVRVADLAHGPFAPGTRTSLRTPPALTGLGLLEAVPEEAILALADPADEDGDGVSGRPNRVPDRRSGTDAVGRFGWKAGQPDLEHQVAKALYEDLGVTSPLRRIPQTPRTRRTEPGRDAGDGPPPEIGDHRLRRLTLYLRLLAVPARRDPEDPEVLRGERLFGRLGCAGCHHPRWTTGTVSDLPELSGRTIRPYTDLLLHDMGPELADGRSEHGASGREWRTPPLWGLGLLGVVRRADEPVRLLHDGRARSPEEAILWHGGEARSARDAFVELSSAQRAALLRFLGSL